MSGSIDRPAVPFPIPGHGDLIRAFACLDEVGFPRTSRVPLFASRFWNFDLERRAHLRFRQGVSNIDEVAVPRWYQRRLPLELRGLFAALTLGRETESPEGEASEPLAVLHDGRSRWRVTSRFSRYILSSPPSVVDSSMVYFGDDTLFLMETARRLLYDIGKHNSDPKVRVLDLCCGGGGVGLALPAFPGELHGVDINPVAVAVAKASALAQGLESYHYRVADAQEAFDQSYDLVVGNPPTFPPELVEGPRLYATGTPTSFLDLLNSILERLTPKGRVCLTLFALAEGSSETAADCMRASLRTLVAPYRAYSYSVRRQFPVGDGRWLRHVALELGAADEAPGEQFAFPAATSFQLPWLEWRRTP